MPKLVDPEERRAYFATCGLNLIAAQGLEAFTLRAVAAEAGVTTGALTHYFPSREALIMAVLDLAAAEAGKHLTAAFKGAGSDYARLHAVLLGALPLDAGGVRAWRIWIAFWAAALGDAALAEENGRRYTQWRDLILMLLRPLVGNEAEANREANLLAGVIDGFGRQIAIAASSPRGCSEDQARAVAAVETYLARFRR
ncbi:MAG TPA: TetR/AcrR family transcriptional regulator [Asticcacaulis sp.]|nr:TetR/AcrR family transcriptional regulator [Asticcacaulis sp.]